MVVVSQLYIHPVKSMQGIALTSSYAQRSGLNYDRIFMVSEPNGAFITAREMPKLLQLHTAMNEQGLVISINHQQKIQVNYADFSKTASPTQIRHHYFSSYIAAISVNQFLSNFLQKDVQLRWIGQKSDRCVNGFPDTTIGFADGFPYLLINQASFNYLQQQCPQKLLLTQFRGNIIINNSLPFAEDSWKTIKIGDVIFDLIKPCQRCVMTQINLTNMQFNPDNEPLKTLSYFRQDEQGKIDFGMNMIARNSGQISVNDPVEIISRQTAKKYNNAFPVAPKRPTTPCKIKVNDQIIDGNNQQPLLEQLEQNNIAIPYSCRAGICGRCLIELEAGEVTPLIPSAIKRNNRILACSCIPKTTTIKLKILTNKRKVT